MSSFQHGIPCYISLQGWRRGNSQVKYIIPQQDLCKKEKSKLIQNHQVYSSDFALS